MHVPPPTHTSIHVPPPAPASPPAKPFSSHLSKQRTATRATASSPAGTTHAAPPPAATSGTTASGTATATAPAAGSSGAAPSGTSSPSPVDSTQSSLNQSEDENMQFLALQSQMDTQSEMFTAMSNVEKTQTDTLKNTAQNMAI